jgi:hypothetical protein
LNKTKQEKIIENRPDNALTIGAWVLAIFGIIIALITMAMITRKTKAPLLDETDEEEEPPKSEDYEKVDDEEEAKEEIPMATAKMKDDENLDDVMKKLKE